jgi:hypothetical protein
MNVNNVVSLALYHVAAQAETDMGRVLVLHNHSSHYLLAHDDAELAEGGLVRIERSWPCGAGVYAMALQAMAVRAAELSDDHIDDPSAADEAELHYGRNE